MKVKLGEKHLYDATSLIQDLILDPLSNHGMDFDEVDKILKLAEARKPGYDVKTQEIIKTLMKEYGLSVRGMDDEQAAWEIYKYGWGLDVIEELYNMPHVDEIRVNNPEQVFYQDRGWNKKADVKFKDEEHIKKLLDRVLKHDRLSLDESNPGCESKLLDGTRLTALTYPLVENTCCVFRRQGTFDISDENYIKSGSMDRYTLCLLSTLVKGRANILVVGDANSGKTTLVRWLAKFLNDKLRIITLETSRELFLNKWYPYKDIISIEAHPELGWDMRRCFALILRLSPNVIIVGEARGMGEAGQMINACRSGHHGTMGTLHVYSVYEAPSALAQMAMEEGRRLPLSVLENQVAAAFDIIIQMHGDDGVRRIDHIVEVSKGKDGPEFRDLCVWEPSEESYDKGKWKYPYGISSTLAAKLFRWRVSKAEIASLERMRKDAA